MALIASLSDNSNTFGTQNINNSKIVNTIAIIDVKITLRGKTFEAFTIPQTAKS